MFSTIQLSTNTPRGTHHVLGGPVRWHRWHPHAQLTSELPTILSFFLVLAATNGLSAIQPMVNHEGALMIKMASDRSG